MKCVKNVCVIFDMCTFPFFVFIHDLRVIVVKYMCLIFCV